VSTQTTLTISSHTKRALHSFFILNMRYLKVAAFYLKTIINLSPILKFFLKDFETMQNFLQEYFTEFDDKSVSIEDFQIFLKNFCRKG
jgi:hypothetical protein